MRVVVTGGAGFLGSHTVEHFHKKGHEVLVVDNLSRGLRSRLPDGVAFSQTDIASPTSYTDVVSFRPHAVVHLAAQMSVVDSLKRPLYDAQVNIVGTLNMLEAARQAQAAAFVFASSGGAVYGDSAVLPCDEDQTPIAPQSPYGAGKASAEMYLELYQRQRDTTLRCVSLRLSNVFGPRQSDAGEGGVISIFADCMANRTRMPVLFGDGRQTRDFVYVTDVVDAIDCAIASEASGPFNIGTGRETSLLSLTEMLRDITGYDGPMDLQPARDGEVSRSYLSCDKAYESLGWTPKTPLVDGLKETVESIRTSCVRSHKKETSAA